MAHDPIDFPPASPVSFAPGSAPAARRDLAWSVALTALVFLVCLAVRLLELPAWSRPDLRVDGAPILATHDSYFWMAGAEGVRATPGSWLGAFTGWLGRLGAIVGLPLPWLTFLCPAVLGSCTAVAVLAWGRRLGGRWAGLAAGLFGALAVGFFSRTRLGYYDTDMFTLLMPLLTGLMLAALVEPRLRPGWLPRGGGEPAALGRNGAEGAWRPLLTALGFGLAARLAGVWHADLVLMHLALWFLALGLLLVLGRPGRRADGILLLTIFAMAAFPDAGGLGLWPPLAAVWGDVAGRLLGGFSRPVLVAALTALPVGLWAARRATPRGFLGRSWLPLLLLAALVLLGDLVRPLLSPLAGVQAYLHPAGPALPASAGVHAEYPSVVQSIIEARRVSLEEVLARLGPTDWLSAAGALGYLFVCWRRPTAVLLLPLLVLSFLSVRLGIRFTMFGGPAVALGLGVPLSWGTRRLAEGRPGLTWFEPAAQLAVGLLLLLPLALRYRDLSPTPVLTRPYAEALLELGRTAPADAEVWTWWDWGYATQFYARRMTPIDGGRHDGRAMYPVALALTTPSLRQANNLIRYAAAQGYDPARVWDGMSARAVRNLLEGLGRDTVETPGIPPQYLVVSWANVDISAWITYFGTWDVTDGSTACGRAERLDRPFDLDAMSGTLTFRDGAAPLAVSSVDLLGGGPLHHLDFLPNLGGPHLVLNKAAREAELLDDTVYYSAMVQLLVADPNSPLVRPFFELKVDRSPAARIYRVVGS